ncbi:hypothetical protein ASD15_10650 [Massilia sp. Root351]|jgi:hypothetical protein|uniref:sulfotransferase n=1 Tax=Massilia sp. Root351 TaxID=1736522 RepID=UPI00071108B5|nr:sulfotransferase [Massilia sp. Root351]KQV82472.1 hypothetical protein ASD15_10650 [Massilia sp. Root351]
MDSLLASVNSLRAVPHAPWRASVRRVAVILTSSRSGSTLFKAAMASHPGVAALDGEAEPFLALSGNGFGQDAACASDAIDRLAQPDRLADNIFDGLSIATAHIAPLGELQQRWSKRLLLQFPALFGTRDAYARLQQALAASFGAACEQAPGQGRAIAQQDVARAVLAGIFGGEHWRLDYYDGKIGPGECRPFAEAAKIEEPPFVLPDLRRRRCTEDDAASKVLLFKTPSDAYRPGLYQQLFPNADVRHIHLTRGYAQCVNGLMDGWLSPTGFFSHDMARAGAELAIEGYSNFRAFGRRWWKFDLPPNWRAYARSSLELVCLNQWLSCHRHILDSGVAAHRVAFEDFLADPAGTLARVYGWLDLPPPPDLCGRQLPVTMATETPAPGRWRKRRLLLEPLARLPDVARTMRELGYGAEPEAWQ